MKIIQQRGIYPAFYKRFPTEKQEESIRKITEADRKFFYKNRKYDVLGY